MSKFKSIFVDCSKAGNCCDKAQYNEASLPEKVKMLVHLALCKPCRKYSNKNTKLTKLIKDCDLKTCTDEEKQAWKEKIRQEISLKERS